MDINLPLHQGPPFLEASILHSSDPESGVVTLLERRWTELTPSGKPEVSCLRNDMASALAETTDAGLRFS